MTNPTIRRLWLRSLHRPVYKMRFLKAVLFVFFLSSWTRIEFHNSTSLQCVGEFMQASADRWEVSNGQVPSYHSPLHILSYRNYHFFLLLSRVILSCLSQSLSQSLSLFSTHKHMQNWGRWELVMKSRKVKSGGFGSSKFWTQTYGPA